MPSWAMRPVLPSGSTFDGQLVYNMTNVEIPDSLVRFIENIDYTWPNRNIDKYTGFEKKKYRLEANTGTDFEVFVSIMLVGDLPRWLQQLFMAVAKGCNGGMQMDFYDSWATYNQYTGHWTNAADFVDNSELLCGGSIDMAVFKVQDIGD